MFKKLNELRRYYDRKSTLNVHHSENIIDIFKFSVRNDKVLSQGLGGDFTEFDFEAKQNSEMDETSYVAPQPKSMEVESRSKVKALSQNYAVCGEANYALVQTTFIRMVLHTPERI